MKSCPGGRGERRGAWVPAVVVILWSALPGSGALLAEDSPSAAACARYAEVDHAHYAAMQEADAAYESAVQPAKAAYDAAARHAAELFGPWFDAYFGLGRCGRSDSVDSSCSPEDFDMEGAYTARDRARAVYEATERQAKRAWYDATQPADTAWLRAYRAIHADDGGAQPDDWGDRLKLAEMHRARCRELHRAGSAMVPGTLMSGRGR